MIDDDVDDFLEHFGVKGQKWGVRRQRRKASDKELKETKKKNKAAENEAKKDPSFRQEVRATRRGRGISGATAAEKTKTYGRMTGRVLGDFTNSRGEQVSVDFANAVLNRAVSQRDFQNRVAAGAAFAGGILLAKAVRP